MAVITLSETRLRTRTFIRGPYMSKPTTSVNFGIYLMLLPKSSYLLFIIPPVTLL